MANNKKNIKEGTGNIKEVVGRGLEDEKRGTQLVAFRADTQTLKRIKALEGIKENTRTEVIIRSIQNSYNGILFQDAIDKLVPLIKKIFKNIKLTYAGFGSKKDLEPMEDPFEFDLTFSEGSIYFDLPDHEFKTKNRALTCFLNLLIVKLDILDLKNIKIKTIKPIVIGPVGKFDPLFFKKLHEIATKNKLEVRSHTRKEGLGLEFRIDWEVSLEGKDWIKNYEKKLVLLKTSIESIEKEGCFIKEGKEEKK